MKLCSHSERAHGKRHECGQPAVYAVRVGDHSERPSNNPKRIDTFYRCEEHLQAIVDRAKETGYSVVSVDKVGG